MNHDPPDEDFARQLVAGSHAEGVTRLAVAVLIEADDTVLLVKEPGHDFIDAHFTLPSDLVLAGETLLDALYRVAATTAGLQVQHVLGYLGHHDLVNHPDALRVFVFSASAVDPQTICRAAAIGHQWVDRDELDVLDGSVPSLRLRWADPFEDTHGIGLLGLTNNRRSYAPPPCRPRPPMHSD